MLAACQGASAEIARIPDAIDPADMTHTAAMNAMPRESMLTCLDDWNSQSANETEKISNPENMKSAYILNLRLSGIPIIKLTLDAKKISENALSRENPPL